MSQKKVEDGPGSARSELPSKEATIFRSVVRFYEGKQYKKAVKAADTILKKFPEHGETLSMKGLTLNSLEKKEEAYELVRKGLKCDLKSHVCWHVYGLLYRSDREYREAIKCYMCALRIDKENVQILRDLALLQIQMRDLSGFVDTRQQLLAAKPAQRNHWISLAVAHHANKSYDVAVQVIDAFEATLDGEIPENEVYEFSEMLMYKATILEEAGKYQEALDLLDKSKDNIKDKLAMDVMKASLYFNLGRMQESETEYRALLDANPDHYQMHTGLQTCMGLKAAEGSSLTAEQVAALTKLYAELSAAYPRSLACKRIQLDFKSGAEFQAALDTYARHYLRKGVPSLFMDLRPLYKDEVKVKAVQDLFESCLVFLAATPSTFPSAAAEEKPEAPQVRVWVLYYLAQHYDRLGLIEKALQRVDEALAHTPTLIELYTIKTKILKHAGDYVAAAHQAETGRRFDLSDRYLNSAAVKALLRCGKEETAILTAALFLKDGDLQATSLYEMQASWFELAAGAAYLRKQEFGKALKKYLAVTKHFDDFHEDQFDFHSYCIRKSTLRAYVALLRFEDALFNHAYFSKAAQGAITCYLALHDMPHVASPEEVEEALMAGMTAEERKKHKLKKKKEEKLRLKEVEEKERVKAEAEARIAKEKEASSSSADKKKAAASAAASTKAADPDPDGVKLAKVEDPLAEAIKLVVILKEHATGKLGTHLAAFEVYIRKERMLLALSAVQRAMAIAGASNPDAHRTLIKLAIKAGSKKSENAVVDELLTSSIKTLLGGKEAKAYADDWVKVEGSASLQHRLAAAETLVLVDAAAKPQAMDLLLASPFGISPLDNEECRSVHVALSAEGGLLFDAGKAGEWKVACATEFPHSTYFEGADVLQYEQYEFDGLTEAFGKLAF